MTKEEAKKLVQTNRVGWEALQHRDGWWVGTEKGVTCYGDHQLARAALTIITARENGRRLFRIATFTGASHNSGEHTPELGIDEAMKRYERYFPNSSRPRLRSDQ